MAIERDICFLFTDHFPYGTGEVFVEKEMPYLCKVFREIKVFPLNKGVGSFRNLPVNVEVIYLHEEGYNNLKDKDLKDVLNLFSVFFYELRVQFSSMIYDLRWNRSYLRNAFQVKQNLKKYLLENGVDLKKVVLYSYWFDTWALSLCILKYSHQLNDVKIISRAHGFDVYKEQARKGYHPFKNFMFRELTCVYPVSKNGANYLKINYERFQDKIKAKYLGTEPAPVLNKVSEHLHIVTCANVTEIKRLYLVPEILQYLPESIKCKWTHLGGGEDLNLLRSKCSKLKPNVEVNFPGNLTKEEINGFYKANPVSVFISVSRSEGLPYSMMEAISFGIPLISTDVGGCSEICTKETGILIPKDFDTRKVAEKLVEFMNSSMNTAEFREDVFRFWDNNFNANRNYFEFYNEISKH